MSVFNVLLKMNVFKNDERFNNGVPLAKGKPNYSNNKLVINADIPAGEYSLAVWQYEDTGNLSLSLSARPVDEDEQDNEKDEDDDFV